jgi:hypothetical protein
MRRRRLMGVSGRPHNFSVRPSMTLSPSRALSLPGGCGGLYTRLVDSFCSVGRYAHLLAARRFDLVPGADGRLNVWYLGPGSQIDTHTPPPAIAAMGWIFLLVFATALFFVRYPGD